MPGVEMSSKDERDNTVTPEPNEKPDTAQPDSKEIKDQQEYDSPSSPSTVDGVSTSKSPAASPVNGTKAASDNLSFSVDTRLPYRQGSPLLLVLPVHTSRDHIPKTLLSNSAHLLNFRTILAEHKVSIHEIEIAHRFNPGTPIGKETLTLCVQSDVSCSEKWVGAIHALRAYIAEEALTLIVEILDHRIFKGLFTLPILSYDSISPFLHKRKHGIVKTLNESGEEWTSLEFFYRGLGPTRNECKATVLIGVPQPNRSVWWEVVLPAIEKKVGGKVEVEICWRSVVKF